MWSRVFWIVGTLALAGTLPAAETSIFRCEVIPLPRHEVSFRIDGKEKLRWHFGPEYPRPFFYPLNGPAGTSLIRMGHPGAPNHDHHRGVWFAHHSVNDRDFWADRRGTQIRQKMWYTFADGAEEAIMAVQLGWFDASGAEHMEQDVVAAIIPLEHGEHQVEFQITLRPPGNRPRVELGKTNFGFLAVRVAKSISEYFGGGKLTSSEGRQGESEIFGKRNRWVDYSGPVPVGEGPNRSMVAQGITYFDHPENPRYPTHWHVREDGWMGASFGMRDGYRIETDQPLVLRYLLYAHAGACDRQQAKAIGSAFAARPGFEISKSQAPHQQFEVRRNE